MEMLLILCKSYDCPAAADAGTGFAAEPQEPARAKAIANNNNNAANSCTRYFTFSTTAHLHLLQIPFLFELSSPSSPAHHPLL